MIQKLEDKKINIQNKSDKLNNINHLNKEIIMQSNTINQAVENLFKIKPDGTELSNIFINEGLFEAKKKTESEVTKYEGFLNILTEMLDTLKTVADDQKHLNELNHIGNELMKYTNFIISNLELEQFGDEQWLDSDEIEQQTDYEFLF